MVKKIKPYSKGDIEGAANKLLRQYQIKSGGEITLPIPIEDIAENHLKLSLDLDDLHERLGIPMLGHEPEVLGALWVDSGEIFIDQSLDPDEYPWKEGRYRFTVAHEIGHWRLHRHLLASQTGQRCLLGDRNQPTVVCRTSEGQDLLEWQANYFGSCLLMPQALVHEAWVDQFEHSRPVHAQDCGLSESKAGAKTHSYHRSHHQPYSVNNPTFEKTARSMAAKFSVSRSAMRIRLEKLGLFVREAPRQRHFAGVEQ